MENKIYGFHIDALRLCFEAEQEELLEELSTIGPGDTYDFYDFYLFRIEGKHFEYVYQIRYNDLGEDKLFGELRFGLSGKEKDNIHTNGKPKVWISLANRVLYSNEIHYLGYISDTLCLNLHNITALDVCLDMRMNIARYLRRLIRNKNLCVILNGKRIKDRTEDRPEITYTMSGNLDRDKYMTLNIKQKKAIKDKTKGTTLIAYDKKAEIANRSSKNYIAEAYNNPQSLHRLEVHLNNEEIKDFVQKERANLTYMTDKGEEIDLWRFVYDEKLLFKVFFETLSSLIRFEKVDWWDILGGNITTTPAKGKKTA